MSRHHIASLLSLLLVVGSSLAAQTAGSSRTSTAAEPGVLEQLQKAVVRGSEAAAAGFKRGVKAAEHGAKAAANAVERGAKAAANAVQHGAQAAGNAAKSLAAKAGAPSSAASQPNR